MVVRRLIRPGEYGAVLYGRVEPTVVERRVIKPPGAIQLVTGEYVSESEFKKLTPAEQAYLKKRGVAAFNTEQQRVGKLQVKAYEEAVAFVGREIAEQERWYKENIIEVGPERETILKSRFEKLDPVTQKLLKEVGTVEFNRRVEVAKVVYTQAVSELTFGQRAEVEATGSYTIVETEADAIRRVKSENPWATNVVYDKATGQITYNLPDPVSYLRNNPGDISGLVKMGHNESTVRSINAALVDTKDFWNEDGSFQGDKYLRLHPDKEDSLYTLGFKPEQIEEIKAYNEQPLSKAAFVQTYFVDREWDYTSSIIRAIKEIPMTLLDWEGHQQELDRYNEASRAYIEDYGLGEYYRSAGIELATLPLPALRALYPEVELKDITGVEWAFTALIPITIATGGLAGIVGVGLRGIALRGISTLAGAGITSLMGYETVRNWEKMSDTERTVSVGITVLAALGTVAAGVSTIKGIGSYVALKPVLKVAEIAGKKNITMIKANKAVKAKMTPRNLTKLQKTTQESITADLKFLDKFSALKRIDKKSLSKLEKLTGMKGLRKVVLGLTKQHKAFETTLKSMKKTPITAAKAARLLTIRNKYFEAIDKFSDIAQPRSMHWRVPSPERTIIETEHVPISIAKKLQAEWDAVATKLYETKVGSSEYYRLIEKQQSMIRRSYALEATEKGVPADLQKLFDEINRYNREHLRAVPEPLAPTVPGAAKPRVRVAVAEKPVEVIAPKIAKPAIVEPKVEVTTEVAEKVAVAKAPKVSAFPGLTSPKIVVRTPTRTETVPAEHIGAMTPEQARRLYGGEIALEDVVGRPIPGVEVGVVVKEWMTPADAIREAQRVSANSAVKDMVNMIEQLRNQGATQSQINTSVQQLIQQAIQVATKTALQQALQTQLKTTTQPATRTALRTGITVITTTPVTVTPTPGIPFIPVAFPDGDGVKKKEKVEYPDGSPFFKMGVIWHLLPYRRGVLKPISTREPPEDATVLEGSPQQTLGFVGGVIPKRNTLFDMGFIDGYIDVKSKPPKIHFASDWRLVTDVGKRMSSTTKGYSLEEAEALGIELPKVRGAKSRMPKVRESKPGVVTLG